MQYLTAWVGRVPGEMRVLDAGCGSGLSLLYMYKYYPTRVKEYVGIDLRTERLRDRYRFVTLPHRFLDVDLDSNWKFGLFDVIFCSEVIEHVIEDRRLFSRLCAHLSDKGVLLLTTPNKTFVARFARVLPGFDAISAAQDGGHVRTGYEPADLERFGRSNGVVSVGCFGLGRMSIHELRRRHAIMKEGEYVNTRLFNVGWLLRRTEPGVTQCDDNCWTLAMAFAKKRERQPADQFSLLERPMSFEGEGSA
jgi:SAM-dependent methyltransferase